jgi:hypothetical protein
MLKRTIYLQMSISLLLLLPSIYGVLYCFVSERMVELVPPLEKEIIDAINKYENEKLVCQIEGYSENEDNLLTAGKIVETDKEIAYRASDCFSHGFNDSIGDFTYFVLRINSDYTSNIEKLRDSLLKLKHHIFEIRRNSEELFCYLDARDLERLQLTDQEISGILSSEGEADSYYTKLLSERLKAEYGESLESRKAKAQENLHNHIAKLKEFLSTIKAARLAHEPYRPTIRFIGWFWLIFEIIGMILLFGKALLELKAWSQRKKERHEHQ